MHPFLMTKTLNDDKENIFCGNDSMSAPVGGTGAEDMRDC